MLYQSDNINFSQILNIYNYTTTFFFPLQVPQHLQIIQMPTASKKYGELEVPQNLNFVELKLLSMVFRIKLWTLATILPHVASGTSMATEPEFSSSMNNHWKGPVEL